MADHDHPGSGTRSHWDDYGHLARLLDPKREEWFPRPQVLALLGLQEGMTVADIGAGSGYTVPALAVAVGRAGRVIAVDPSPAARLHLQERIADGQFQHVVIREGTAEATGLADGEVDRILWQAIYHELKDRAAAYREAHRILRPRGVLVVVDWKAVATDFGPPLRERIPAEQAGAEARAAGFHVEDETAVSAAVWGLRLRRP